MLWQRLRGRWGYLYTKVCLGNDLREGSETQVNQLETESRTKTWTKKTLKVNQKKVKETEVTSTHWVAFCAFCFCPHVKSTAFEKLLLKWRFCFCVYMWAIKTVSRRQRYSMRLYFLFGHWTVHLEIVCGLFINQHLYVGLACFWLCLRLILLFWFSCEWRYFFKRNSEKAQL